MTSKELTFLLIKLSLGIIYFTSGLSKLAPEHLGNIIGPVSIENSFAIPGIDIFMQIVAVIQTILGALILTQRYSVIGLALLLPLSTGILIFTIFSGFGLTPLINVLLLILLIYAIFIEKNSVRKFIQLKMQAFKDSNSFEDFPKKKIPDTALLITSITVIISFWNKSLLLNLTASTFLVLIFLNLFQKKDYLTIDYLILLLFFVISFVITNALLLNQLVDKAFYSVFLLIPMGFLIYFLRLIYSRFFNS